MGWQIASERRHKSDRSNVLLTTISHNSSLAAHFLIYGSRLIFRLSNPNSATSKILMGASREITEDRRGTKRPSSKLSFQPQIRATGSLASPCARSTRFRCGASDPRSLFGQPPTREGLAGSTSPSGSNFFSALPPYRFQKTGRGSFATLARFSRARRRQHSSLHACISDITSLQAHRWISHRRNETRRVPS